MSKLIDEDDFNVSLSSDDEDDDDEIYDEDDDENIDEDDDEIIEEEIATDNVIKDENYIDEEQYENEDIQYQEIQDEEPIENYLQKITDTLKTNIINDYHPQLKPHNFEEIELLTKIVRNKNGDIIDDLHKTSPFMTKYERSRILAERTVQINSGANIFVENNDNEIIDGYLIALNELKQKKIPFIIKRPLPNGTFEYWNVNDLEIL